MEDNTSIIEKVSDSPSTPKVESHLFNISIRGIITMLVVGTVCFMSLNLMEVKEPLYSLCTVCLGYYFGQRDKPKTQQ